MRVIHLIALFGIVVVAIASNPGQLVALTAPVQTQESNSDAEAGVMDGASTWQLDNEHTTLVCAVSHYGLSFIYGRFNECSGSVEMNFQEPGSTRFSFEIDSASIDTNNAMRDVLLRGPNCLNVAEYGTVSFESLEVKTTDEPTWEGKRDRSFEVTGNLTMLGETRRTTIPMQFLAMGLGPDGKLRCGFISKFVIQRSDFGLDAMPESVGDSVAVTFCFQAIRQQKEKAQEPATVKDQSVEPEKKPDPENKADGNSSGDGEKELDESKISDADESGTDSTDRDE